MAMPSKELTSASSRASSLRSAKRYSEATSLQNGSVSSPSASHPVEDHKKKRANFSSQVPPSMNNGIHIQAGGESAEYGKMKKKRKLFKGFSAKKRCTKRSKPHPKLGDDNPVVAVSSLDARLHNPAAVDCTDDYNCFDANIEPSHETLLKQERHTTTNQSHESPIKARISTPRLQVSTCTASPKKSSRHQDFDPSDSGHMQAVKAALHLSTVPDTLICRDIEQSKVFEFCKDHIVQQQPGSLYVCGCPGTGKSLLMEKVKFFSSKWAEGVGAVAPEISRFNCTSLTNPKDIFDRILQHVSPHQIKKEMKNCVGPGLTKLKFALSKSGDVSNERMLLLIVDEIDFLLSKDQAILRELFELPAQKKSRCILIGISNSIDLADRCLQSFSSLSCRPVVIPFSPYSKEQVLAVLNQRLKALPFSAFHPEALELCARKVAAASGDMRRALHVCRIAIELLELERNLGTDQRSAPNATRVSKAEAPPTPSKKIGSPGQKKQEQWTVQIYHMAQALTKMFRSAAVDTVKSLPKHQQMVLCAAVRLFRQNKKDTTLGQLNGRYVDFCKATGMPALSVPEFSSVCRVLADQGLLNLGTSREERLKRVTLQVDQDDIVFALQAIRFFCNNLT
ncbi:hypothetical protein GOP47_0000337 [Adiantum capillus-veneris]|uniref:Cell division control protein n=1 Tax=Adiantum capillus-veneris TaxID=13818 RepID=A0A9D4VES3_ADICA|nr:hypothetical protein GOP47_0000337 [Adiantum capillus-veneris]